MKMIKITSSEDNTPIFINVDRIEAVYCDEDNNNVSIITTIDDHDYYCTETPEKVYQKIKETEND